MSLTFSSVTRDNLPAAYSISLNKRHARISTLPRISAQPLRQNVKQNSSFDFTAPLPYYFLTQEDARKTCLYSFFMSFIYSGISTEV